MTTENNSEIVPVAPAMDAAATRKLNFNSLLFGAYSATAVLAIYSLINIVGTAINTIVPYIAGGTLFVVLTTIFLTILGTLKKHRKGARKTLATWDTFGAIAIITVLGYFAAACVATFQPGNYAADLWTNGAISALLWSFLFGGGKYAAELFNDKDKASTGGRG